MRALWQAGLVLGCLALVPFALVPGGRAAGGDGPDSVIGRWNVTSDVGGAVWTFRPGGKLTLIGPGDILSEGDWAMADDQGAFDAMVDVAVTGQQLTVLGQVSPDGAGIALYVTATDAARPEDWAPWPAESRLTGRRSLMVPDVSPSPSKGPDDCLRPQWIDGVVDWDRCDGAAGLSGTPSASGEPGTAEATASP